jgi:hypothetical protein
MANWHGEFTHIKALVLLNVVSGETFIEREAENVHGDPAKAAEMLDQRLRELTGVRFDEETPWDLKRITLDVGRRWQQK